MYFFEQLLYEQTPVTQGEPQQVPQMQPEIQPKLEKPTPNQHFYQDIPDDVSFSEDELEKGDGDDIESVQDSSSSLIPIKRYFLIQKLFALNDKLNQLRIKNDILNLVISFIDSFSYESLLMISNKIAEEIYLQVKSPEEKTTTTDKKKLESA